MRRSKVVVAVAAFASLVLGGLAWADVPPPAAEACLGKQVGDVCDVPDASGAKGVCVQTTCTKVTPPPLPDSGPYTYPCVLCQLPPDGGVKPAADTGTRPADVGACPTPNACQAPAPDSGPKPTADGGPASKDAGGVHATEKDSGCAVGGVSVTRVLGPWFLAVAVSAILLVLGRRRRR